MDMLNQYGGDDQLEDNPNDIILEHFNPPPPPPPPPPQVFRSSRPSSFSSSSSSSKNKSWTLERRHRSYNEFGYGVDPCSGDFSSDAALTFNEKFSLTIEDPIHGTITLDPMAVRFINTPQFQRLKKIRQLGIAYKVIPRATHSRYDHSLGVYSLASTAVNALRYNQPELEIDDFDVQAVKLAGLLHDVGHGPFSHVFEQDVFPSVYGRTGFSHQEMSVKIIDYIMDQNNIDMPDDIMDKVKLMIIARSDSSSVQKRAPEKQFLYDIVANSRTGIGCDEFDYIVRDAAACKVDCNIKINSQIERMIRRMKVIGNEICFHAHDYSTVNELVAASIALRRDVYSAEALKLLELMFVDYMRLAPNISNEFLHIDEPAAYCQLDDTIMQRMQELTQKVPSEYEDMDEYLSGGNPSSPLLARLLRYRIDWGRLYQLCRDYRVPEANLAHFKEVTAEDIVSSQTAEDFQLKLEDVAISNCRVNFSRGEKLPTDSIKFYKGDGSSMQMQRSLLIPGYTNDLIVRVYAKKDEHENAISTAFDNFLWNTYQLKLE